MRSMAKKFLEENGLFTQNNESSNPANHPN